MNQWDKCCLVIFVFHYYSNPLECLAGTVAVPLPSLLKVPNYWRLLPTRYVNMGHNKLLSQSTYAVVFLMSCVGYFLITNRQNKGAAAFFLSSCDKWDDMISHRSTGPWIHSNWNLIGGRRFDINKSLITESMWYHSVLSAWWSTELGWTEESSVLSPQCDFTMSAPFVDTRYSRCVTHFLCRNVDGYS